MLSEQSKDLDELQKYLPPQAVVILRKLFDPRNLVQHQGGLVVKAPPKPQQNLPGKLPNRPGQAGTPVFQAPGLSLDQGASAQFDGQPRGVIRYAVVTADWTSRVNTKSNQTEYWTEARDCTQDGIRPQGPKFQMRCILTGGQEPAIDVGDVLPYFFDIHGNAVTFPSQASNYYYANSEEEATPEPAPAPAPAPMLFAPRVSDAGLRFPEIEVRNLIYHIYPHPKNDGWKRNLRQIKGRMGRFNGRKIMAIATGDGLVPPRLVEETIDLPGAEYVLVPNDRRLRETASFPTLLKAVATPDCRQATFYAHTKGNSNAHQSPQGMEFWRNAAYHALLENIGEVQESLRSAPAVGIHKIVWKGKGWSPFPSGIDPRHHWMFAGTFFWFRHDAVFNGQDWENAVLRDRYGTEAWLAAMFPADQCVSLYQRWPESQFPTPNPYDPALYERPIHDHTFAVSVVIPCKGRVADMRKAVEAWYSQNVAPYEVIVVDYGCPNGTLDAVREMRKTYPGLRCVSLCVGGYNASRARNLGGVRALGNVLAFGDADFWPRPGFLEACWREYQQDQPLVVYRYPDGAAGGQMVVSAELYNKLRGFDESVPTYGHEDTDFYARCQAAGGEMGFVNPETAECRGNSETERLRFYQIANTQAALDTSLAWMRTKRGPVNPHGYGVIG